MTADLVLAVDVGTTNLKAGVLDASGNVLSIARQELTVERDETGKAEHDPNVLWADFLSLARQAAKGYEDRIQILALSTYQMGLLAVDSDGQPLTGILTLLDTRPRETYQALLERLDGEALYRRTGCPPLFHFPLAKLFWLQTKRAGIYAKARWFLSSKDFLLLRLVGEAVTDTSVSSTTQYMNIASLTWDTDTLVAIDADPDRLPRPLPPETIWRDVPQATKDALGLPNLTGVLLGSYDGGAVGLGLGAMDPSGLAVMNFGTTAMLRYAAPTPGLSAPPSMDIQSSYLASSHWIPGGAVNNAGAVLRWLKDQVFGVDYEVLTASAKAVTDTRGLIFLPYLSGERSLTVSPDASGVYFGLRASHERGHMVRAAMEGVAFALRRVREALAKNGVHPAQIRVGSGGAHSDLWMEIVASVLNTPLQTTRAEEPGLLGSAMLAYVALGQYPDLAAATQAMVHTDHTYAPRPELTARYDEGFAFFEYLLGQMNPCYDRHGAK